MQHNFISALMEVVQYLPLEVGEVGHYGAHVKVIAWDQDLGLAKDQAVLDMMHIPLHVLEEVVLVSKVNFTVRKFVYSVQQVLNGEVGLYGAHVEVNAWDQDQENVMDLDVKDFPKSVIHVQEEVVLVE